MLSPEQIIKSLSRFNFGPYICVPCSFLKPIINYVIDTDGLRYIKAVNEGEAVGIASGAYLAGKLPVVMMQNSGLGNAVNPITSLTNIYKIPMLFIISLRGGAGIKDEPQHKIMGAITHSLLTLAGIESSYLPDNEEEMNRAVNAAYMAIRSTSLPYAFILQKGIVAPYDRRNLKENSAGQQRQPLLFDKTVSDIEPVETRIEIIKAIAEHLPHNMPIVSTTGMISRELYTLCDRENRFYMVGSMGHAASLALGITLFKETKVAVLDGDGALLMKMGTLATIGHYAPKNLIHIVLDNRSYDSTGGQDTVSSTVNIAAAAACCGYNTGVSVSAGTSLEDAIKKTYAEAGPHMIHVVVKKGHPEGLGRPSLTPEEQKNRFMAYLKKITI